MRKNLCLALLLLSTGCSTFSADVDTASYSNTRQYLANHRVPPAEQVRIEEMLNYFPYDDPRPKEGLGLNTQLGSCPWNENRSILRIALSSPQASRIPPRNFVFLIDVSGSMQGDDKLPRIQGALAHLAEKLRPQDRLSLVVYAGRSGVVLEPTPGDQKSRILEAIRGLYAEGSTNGGEGIQLAYRVARESFLSEGVNRVILATDGDFNLGLTSESELVSLIETERQSGVYLTVLGCGYAADRRLEQLADKGNGSYALLDSDDEARKVLIDDGGSALVPVADDVKIKVSFSPERVRSARLIGYENRALTSEEFENSESDAGDMGFGHTVTALYELELRGQGSLGAIEVRYRDPATRLHRSVGAAIGEERSRSADLRFGTAVAAFGMLLRKEPGALTCAEVARLAESACGDRKERREFVEMVRQADAAGLRRSEDARNRSADDDPQARCGGLSVADRPRAHDPLLVLEK